MIVAEFFDTGESRVLPWARRPQAAALVAALADPDRGWDAIVIGEYERAFYGSQYASMAPLFEHYGVALWMPEVGGRVDWHAEDHEQTMLALGLSSKREITRTRVRVRTAMAAQTREQGRYLGGRPPYGYRLADAGPHPNKAHAAWGRRAHRLEPDPVTAPVVSWMFAPAAGRAQRRADHPRAERCRGAVPVRGRPRSGTRTGPGAAWTLRTVAAILANPRYTGRQVWNRQRTDADLVDPANTGLGHRQVQRWNLPEGWVISKHPAHPALVSEADFIAAQDTGRAARPGRPGGPPVPARRAAGVRAVRAAAGISLVQRQARLPVPPRLHQRHRPRSRPGRRTPTSARTRSCRTWPPSPSCSPAHAGKPGPGTAAAQHHRPRRGRGLIDQLRADGIVLTYDPDSRTLRAGGHDAPPVTIGKATADTHSTPAQEKEDRLEEEGRSTRRGRRLSAGDDPSMPVKRPLMGI